MIRMKLIAEVYEVTCPACSGRTQALFSPRNIYNTSFAKENDAIALADLHHTSHFTCGMCGRMIEVPGQLISLLSDIEDFDEIEQHR